MYKKLLFTASCCNCFPSFKVYAYVCIYVYVYIRIRIIYIYILFPSAWEPPPVYPLSNISTHTKTNIRRYTPISLCLSASSSLLTLAASLLYLARRPNASVSDCSRDAACFFSSFNSCVRICRSLERTDTRSCRFWIAI